MTETRSFTERGLWFPLGIAIGLGLMVCWNAFFIYTALQTAPEVDHAYTTALER